MIIPTQKDLRQLYEYIINAIPTRWGMRLRNAHYGKSFKSCGENCQLQPGLRLYGEKNISLGRNFYLGFNGLLNASYEGEIVIGNDVGVNDFGVLNAGVRGRIVIGNDVMVAPFVFMRASDHQYDRLEVPMKKQGHYPGEIVIEDDVWIGAQTVIIGGSRIGRGSIIGAGSVVTSEIEPFSIAAGVPARTIRSRSEQKAPREAVHIADLKM